MTGGAARREAKGRRRERESEHLRCRPEELAVRRGPPTPHGNLTGGKRLLPSAMCPLSPGCMQAGPLHALTGSPWWPTLLSLLSVGLTPNWALCLLLFLPLFQPAPNVFEGNPKPPRGSSQEGKVGAVVLRESLSPKPAPHTGRKFSQCLSRRGKAAEVPMFVGPKAPWRALGSSRNNRED